MSDKDLQRLTECVSYIGQPASRHLLPARRRHTAQNIRLADQLTFSISVLDNPFLFEIFLRLEGTYSIIALYNLIARLMSLALRYRAFLEKVGDFLTAAKFAPCRPVSSHDRLKHCSSLEDLIERHTWVRCWRHVEPSPMPSVSAGVWEEAHP